MSNPYPIRKAVWLEGADRPLTPPISREANEALNKALEAHTEQLADVLAPFGLHPYDIRAPEFERVVYEDEYAKAGA